MRGPVAPVAVFALVCGWTVGARAQTPPLDVSRGADAQDCPDAARLSEDIATIRGPAAAAATRAYSVGFARNGSTFSAAIRSGPTGTNVRLLEARGQTCAALAHAVAVTLALLFDSDKIESTDSKPVEVETPEPSPVVVALPPPTETPADERKRSNEATLTVGAAGLLGVLRPFSLALTGELGLEIGRWRTGLGVLWGVPQTLALGPGIVHESLLSASMRVCYAPWRSDGFRFDVCSGAFIGLVQAAGRGYSQNEIHTQPWLAAPLELAAAAFRGPLGLELAAGGLASFQRPDFSVNGVGVAYRSPLFGGTVSLRAIGQWPW
jgi:hypothetical protein